MELGENNFRGFIPWSNDVITNGDVYFDDLPEMQRAYPPVISPMILNCPTTLYNVAVSH